MPSSDIRTKLYESVIQAAQSMVNYCFLLNGSAIVALLTFLGNKDDSAVVALQLGSSLTSFVSGVVAAAVGSITLYFTQLSYFKQQTDGEVPFLLSGTAYRVIFVCVMATSIGLFAWGATNAASSLSSPIK
jgi:hypothetical protein